jgi:hypothetical protein
MIAGRGSKKKKGRKIKKNDGSATDPIDFINNNILSFLFILLYKEDQSECVHLGEVRRSVPSTLT